LIASRAVNVLERWWRALDVAGASGPAGCRRSAEKSVAVAVVDRLGMQGYQCKPPYAHALMQRGHIN
jgi:hypothetical protein